MVGVGPGRRSALGRISIVDYNGCVVYDVMCRPEEVITDYRTRWSGIRPSDMARAIPFDCVREQTLRIISVRLYLPIKSIGRIELLSGTVSKTISML